MANKKLFLCSFATSDLYRQKKNFIKKAKSLGVYSKIKVFTPEDLSNKIKNRINKRLLAYDLRGYGYYCWKPFIIRRFAKSLPKNSIIQYMDIGSDINKKGLTFLKKYIQIVKKKNFLTFKYFKPKNSIKKLKYQVYREYEYTKADIFDEFGLRLNSSIAKDCQIQSGLFFFINDTKSNQILKLWEDKMKNDKLIDDTSSVKKNHKKFIQNRHDQSFFSIICKLYGVFSLSASQENEFVIKDHKIYWNHLINKPFLVKRIKNRSIFNIIKRIVYKLKKNYFFLI